MTADPASNYFKLFGLSIHFDVAVSDLTERYRSLQKAVHPDRFAGSAERDRLMAVQQAANINEAYRVLKDPLARARYMLELKGLPLDDTNTQMDPAFLMEQMELREALEAVKNSDDPMTALVDVMRDLEKRRRALIDQLQTLLDGDDQNALEEARETVRKLQFIQRLEQETESMEEDLADQL